MSDWTFVNKVEVEVHGPRHGNRAMWEFWFAHNETGEQVSVVAENEDHAWEKLTDGEYRKDEQNNH